MEGEQLLAQRKIFPRTRFSRNPRSIFATNLPLSKRATHGIQTRYLQSVRRFLSGTPDEPAPDVLNPGRDYTRQYSLSNQSQDLGRHRLAACPRITINLCIPSEMDQKA